MKKHFLKQGLAATLLLTMLCGCNTAGDAKQSGDSLSDAQTQSANLKIHFHSDNRYTIVDKNGDVLPVFKLAGEKTGVTVENAANPISQNSVEEFQLQATEKFPADIYGGVGIKDAILSYAQQGAFIPLNDLIDKHAPNMKAFFEKNPEAKAAMTAPDGNIYMINYMPDGRTAKCYYIRTDWLKKLGLKMPTNFKELENVLYAFRDKDPNGNNKKDEIPYFNERWQETIRLVNIWGARAYSSENFNDRVPVDANGKLYQAWMTDNFKEGIKNLNRWYKDGILDQEMFTRKTDTVRQTLWAKDNTGGLTHEWVASTSTFNYNKELVKMVPDFKVEGMLPIAVEGKPFEEHQRSFVKPDGWAISVNCKNPEAAICFMDWFFTEEGRRASNFGIEGQSYTMVNNEPKFADEVISQGAVSVYLRTTYGAQMGIGCQQDYNYEKQWTMKEGTEAYNLYNKSDIWSEKWTPMLNFSNDEMEVYDKVITTLNDFQNEKITAFITGKEDIETGWDSYIKRCKEIGADDLVTVYQSAYDRYKKQA